MDQLGSTGLLAAFAASACFLLLAFLPKLRRTGKEARMAARFARHARHGKLRLSADGSSYEAGSAVFEADHIGLVQRLRAALSDRFANIGGSTAFRLLVAAGCTAGAIVLGGTLGWLGWNGGIAVATAVAAAVGTVLIGYMQMKRRWQIAFLNFLADALDLVVRAVRSGIPVSEAIRVAGREINEPVRTEFQRIADSIDLGIDLKEALRSAAARIRLSDFDFFVITLILQRETGGQLADTLEGLSTILRRRKELRLKIRAMTAEGRMSALIVALMPIVAGVGMYLMDPGHVGRLFEPGTGQTMLYGALTLMGVGMLVVYQMTKVKP